MKYYPYLLILGYVLLFIPSYGQEDKDRDAIPDEVELLLARKFAPEWRFNKNNPRGGSPQNHNHSYFPISIEAFYGEIIANQGRPPKLTRISTGESVSLNSFDDLATILVPGTRISASHPSWGWNNVDIRITDYPEKITGDPASFPTYFRCEKIGDDEVEISYFLFYAMDFKGSYTFFGIEPGKHRADWEGISMRISNVCSFDEKGLDETELLYIKMSGHGLKKYITPKDQNLQFAEQTHPRMFIAWGSHPVFPEPGEWHNYDIKPGGDLFDIYDDMFHGDGVVVQSWNPERKLINVGNTKTPLVKWLNYRGSWGPDGNAENGSPGSPPNNSKFWNSSIEGNDWINWATAKNLQGPISPYKTSFKADVAFQNTGWFTNNEPLVVLFQHANWDGCQVTLTTSIGAPRLIFDSTPNFGSHSANNRVSSVLISGGVQLVLYRDENFGGPSIMIDDSIANLKDLEWNDSAGSARIIDPSKSDPTGLAP